MKRFETLKNRPPRKFLRAVGISLDQFLSLRDLIIGVIQAEQTIQPMKKRGRKAILLTVEDKLLLTLTYLRHYPTFEQLGDQFGISEPYAHKIYQQYLDRLVKVCRLPGRKSLLDKGIGAIIIDVTEQPMERPTRHQGDWYSGKKKRHTIKTQLIVGLFSLRILVVACGQGRMHDFALLKQTRLRIAAWIEKYADSGYQGISRFLTNSLTPIKKPKHRRLTPEERAYNRALARLRIHIEHVNRRCKIFRIVKETYRGKHRQYQKTWTVIAGLVNLRYAD